MLDESQLPPLVTFASALIESQDVDPLYPVLRELEKDMEPEQALWFTFLYLTYYNLGSAIHAFRLRPVPGPLPAEARLLPCAIERRNLRGGKVAAHVESYLETVRWLGGGNQKQALQHNWHGHTPEENYLLFWETAQLVWNNGRWAAFKWGELLKKVHGWNLAAPDMRMEFCSGPKAGLEQLYQHPGASVKQLNAYGADLRDRLSVKGVPVDDWETLETVLCNYNSFAAGKYYVGHDIDELQAVIEHSDLSAADAQWVWDARAAVLPGAYLGERNGWHGPRAEWKRQYRDSRKITFLPRQAREL